jgi:hypothetical protein
MRRGHCSLEHLEQEPARFGRHSLGAVEQKFTAALLAVG